MSNSMKGNTCEVMDLEFGSKEFCDLENKTIKFPWLMYFSGFTAYLLLVSSGISMVWLSPVIPKLQSNDTSVNPLVSPVTIPQTSIMAALPPIAGILGLLLSARMLDILGRKKAMMIVALIIVCNVAVTTFATHIYFYYSFLFIRGFSVVKSFVCVSIYNNEIAETGNRGKIGCITGMGASTGILLGYLLGPITSVRVFTLVCGFPALLHLVFSIIIPESPIFLALKGRKIECMNVLEKLRRTKNIVKLETEYNKMQVFAQTSSKHQHRNFLDIFKNRNTRKAFAVSICINLVQQLSGSSAIFAFMAPIFDKSGTLSGNSFGIIAGIVQLIISFNAIFLVDKLGRRLLLLTSLITCAVALFLLGFNFYLQHIQSVYLDNLTWLPILGVLLYISGFGFGLGPLPLVLAGELFPNDLRAIGCGSIMIIDNSALFVTMFSFPLISSYLGVQYCMWFFSSVCLTGFIVMFFVLPETKGKSFLEIQEILGR